MFADAESLGALATILAAIVTVGGLIFVKVLDIKNKITTNHGKQPWEYLEMVGEIHNDQKHLAVVLAEHTASDAKNFEELREGQRKLEEGQTELRSIITAEHKLVQTQREEDRNA